MKNKVKKNDKKEKYNKINFRDEFLNSSKKHIKNGTYSVIMTVLFISVVIVINMIVGELPAKYTELDVSSQKLYSVGDETKEMLAELEKDVTIYQIAQNGAEDEVITNLLKKYEDESEHIKVEQKDPVVNPKFVSEYTSDNLSINSLIIACGERSKVVDYNNMYESDIDYQTYNYQTTGFDGEGQITSAIAYVTSENLPVLYTLTGHGEKEIDSTLKEGIEKANMEIKSLNLVSEGVIPEDADCLFIGSPSTDISSDEKNAILKYLEKGGKALIFSDYTEENMENFNEILANYGLKRTDGIVLEGDSQHYAMQMPYYILPDIGAAEAVSDMASDGYMVLAPFAQGIVRSDDVRSTVTLNSLLSTSEQAFSKCDVSSGSLDKEDGDIDGPFDVGVSVIENIDDKETKLVYYSTSSLIDGQVNQMVSGGNEKLVMESLKWMVDTEGTEIVSIPSKNLQVSSLTISAYDASFWKICVMGLIPGFFLVMGFTVWYKRRRA